MNSPDGHPGNEWAVRPVPLMVAHDEASKAIVQGQTKVMPEQTLAEHLVFFSGNIHHRFEIQTCVR